MFKVQITFEGPINNDDKWPDVDINTYETELQNKLNILNIKYVSFLEILQKALDEKGAVLS